jgi:hypothetical protein
MHLLGHSCPDRPGDRSGAERGHRGEHELAATA